MPDPAKCSFGDRCYRKNTDHIAQFHPERLAKAAEQAAMATESDEEDALQKDIEDFNSRQLAKGRGQGGTKKKSPAKKPPPPPRKSPAKKVQPPPPAPAPAANEVDSWDEEEVPPGPLANNKVSKGAADAVDSWDEEEIPPGPLAKPLKEKQKKEEETKKRRASQSPTKAKRGKGDDAKMDNPRPTRPPFLPQPDYIYEVWERAKELNKDNPCSAFSSMSKARLVGFFDFLDGRLQEEDEDVVRLHARHALDLPEMQTVMTVEGGRYALWRDDPTQEKPLIVFAPSTPEHFPNFKIVGDKLIHAFVHAMAEAADDDLPEFFPDADVISLHSQIKAVVAKRLKTGIGRPFHGIRIWCPVVDDVGYRPIAEDNAKLRREMKNIGEATDDTLRAVKMANLRVTMTNISFANDECDFGTGLEFGHDLFMANYPALDDVARSMLSTAYQLLDRKEFKEIVRAQFAAPVVRCRVPAATPKKRGK